MHHSSSSCFVTVIARPIRSSVLLPPRGGYRAVSFSDSRGTYVEGGGNVVVNSSDLINWSSPQRLNTARSHGVDRLGDC